MPEARMFKQLVSLEELDTDLHVYRGRCPEGETHMWESRGTFDVQGGGHAVKNWCRKCKNLSFTPVSV